MAVGLMVGAAAFFAVGFFAAGTGKDLKKDGSSKQEMDAKENPKQDEEYDYSWAMQGVNRSRIRLGYTKMEQQYGVLSGSVLST